MLGGRGWDNKHNTTMINDMVNVHTRKEQIVLSLRFPTSSGNVSVDGLHSHRRLYWPPQTVLNQTCSQNRAQCKHAGQTHCDHHMQARREPRTKLAFAPATENQTLLARVCICRVSHKPKACLITSLHLLLTKPTAKRRQQTFSASDTTANKLVLTFLCLPLLSSRG